MVLAGDKCFLGLLLPIVSVKRQLGENAWKQE